MAEQTPDELICEYLPSCSFTVCDWAVTDSSDVCHRV